MKEEQGIHYRTGGKLTHCGVEILPNGEDILCIYIKDITFYDSHEVAGKTLDNVWIATFHENEYTDLPMMLNSTNRKRLAKLAKTDYLNLVKDFPVRLTQETARDVQDGGTTKGLRISKVPATIPQKETLDKNHENWEKSKEYIKKGGKISELKKRFEVSKEVEEELKK